MTILATLRALMRRWYIVIPGLILALAVGVVAWQRVAPEYERSAWMLLVPGQGTLPQGSSNPYLFLGGLSPAADALVRAVGSQEVLNDLIAAHPGLALDVRRDPITPSPVVQLTVSAPTDEEAADVLDIMVKRTTEELDTLQNQQDTRPQDRITISMLAKDQVGSVKQRTKVLAAFGSAGLISLFTIVLASALEGWSRRPSAVGAQRAR